MTDRALAITALIVAMFALVAIIGHALIPTPPAHTANPLGIRA